MRRSDEGCGYSVVKVTIRLWREEVGKCTALRRAHHRWQNRKTPSVPATISRRDRIVTISYRLPRS